MALGLSLLLAPAGIGVEPADSLGARDLPAEYHLPPLHDQPGQPLYDSIRGLQVLTRARRLNLGPHSATEAWLESGATVTRARSALEAPFPAAAKFFRGDRASDLNRMLGQPGLCAVRVASPDLRLDTPIYIPSHCSLDLAQATLHSIGDQPYQIQIKARTDVHLSGGHFIAGAWGVSVAGSSGVTLTGMQMDGLAGGGVMVTGSLDVVVAHNRFQRLGGSAIMLHGDTIHAVVAENDIAADTGWSNWHAGVVITDRNADPSNDATTLLRKDGILVKQTRITDRLTIPHDNIILRNRIVGNLTSGIYSDGGARNLFLENAVTNNSKEGMCLDNGSTANVVGFNLFRGNGKRWGIDDAGLKRDYVSSLGRLPDGTSPAKLPGISMDNALYNQVVLNLVDRNFGSGIKMVRTSFYNLVGVNTLTDDNEGSNPHLHFFGILVGSAVADESAWDLDFAPSRGNQFFGNIIRGSHFSGIFFDKGADQNVAFDNSIFGATNWAMESRVPQPEESFNNLSNLPFRNIGAGLNPDLLQWGKAKFDK